MRVAGRSGCSGQYFFDHHSTKCRTVSGIILRRRIRSTTSSVSLSKSSSIIHALHVSKLHQGRAQRLVKFEPHQDRVFQFRVSPDRRLYVDGESPGECVGEQESPKRPRVAAISEAASSVGQLPTIGVKGSGTGFCVGRDGLPADL